MDFSYFLQATQLFDPFDWAIYGLLFGAVLAGAYLGFVFRDSNLIRLNALRRLGYGLLGIGVTGALLGTLRLIGVAGTLQRYWLYIGLLLLLLLLVAALVYAQTAYRAQLAAASRTRTGGRGASRVSPSANVMRGNTSRGATSNGTTPAASEPRPVSLTRRRESRRDRKRKSR